MKRQHALRKSDFKPAFEAAKDAGFDRVSIEVEMPEGQRFLITAARGKDASDPAKTELEKWKSGRAAR